MTEWRLCLRPDIRHYYSGKSIVITVRAQRTRKEKTTNCKKTGSKRNLDRTIPVHKEKTGSDSITRGRMTKTGGSLRLSE